MGGYTPEDDKIRREAQKMGLSLTGAPRGHTTMDMGEIQIRMEKLKAAKRASRMWWLSLLAAFAAVLSAGASWYASLKPSEIVVTLPHGASFEQPTQESNQRGE